MTIHSQIGQLALVALTALAIPAAAQQSYSHSPGGSAAQSGELRRRIGMARFKLESFEKEVAKARGGENQRWFYIPAWRRCTRSIRTIRRCWNCSSAPKTR